MAAGSPQLERTLTASYSDRSHPSYSSALTSSPVVSAYLRPLGLRHQHPKSLRIVVKHTCVRSNNRERRSCLKHSGSTRPSMSKLLRLDPLVAAAGHGIFFSCGGGRAR